MTSADRFYMLMLFCLTIGALSPHRPTRRWAAAGALLATAFMLWSIMV